MGTRCCASGRAIGSAHLSDTKAQSGAPSLVGIRRAQHRVVRTLQRAYLELLYCNTWNVQSCSRANPAPTRSKIWDTYSGNSLHSFPHNHIVRSVAITPSASHLLTGGQEKKVRIFDLARPDAEPDILGGSLSHDGTVKSVVWFDENAGVSAADDGLIK